MSVADVAMSHLQMDLICGTKTLGSLKRTRTFAFGALVLLLRQTELVNV